MLVPQKPKITLNHIRLLIATRTTCRGNKNIINVFCHLLCRASKSANGNYTSLAPSTTHIKKIPYRRFVFEYFIKYQIKKSNDYFLHSMSLKRMTHYIPTPAAQSSDMGKHCFRGGVPTVVVGIRESRKSNCTQCAVPSINGRGIQGEKAYKYHQPLLASLPVLYLFVQPTNGGASCRTTSDWDVALFFPRRG